MELFGLIENGTPVLLLGMLLFLERINVKVNVIQEDVQEIKGGITWHDTCEERKERIVRIEKALNGMLRSDRPLEQSTPAAGMKK